MKHSAIILSFMLFSTVTKAQSDNLYCYDYQRVMKALFENHLLQLSYSDIDTAEFSESLIQFLDPEQLLFEQEDIIRLHSINKALEKNPENVYCNQQSALKAQLKNSIEEAIMLLSELEASSISFIETDSLYINPQYNPELYIVNKEKRWKSYLKYKSFKEVVDVSNNADSLMQQEDCAQILEDRYRKIISEKKNELSELISSDEKLASYVYFRFVNALVSQFDPHTLYFSETMFGKFQEHLSSISNSFGISVTQNPEGKILVTAVLPGSYAWKTGKINIDDEIIAIETSEGKLLYAKKEGVEKFGDFIKGQDKLVLVIQNSAGNEKKITLYREQIKNQENLVQAYILYGQQKIGYIILPAFYTSWETDNSFGCAQDIARAIYALKKENINGLIIDLRNNGGGSIKEAIELAGIFIDFGTLAIAQDRNQELSTLRDFNRGVMYSGPLAIMTNKSSASASEIIAGVLQDYKRALIIGEATYGKASGQILLPIGSAADKETKSSNMLKVTNSRYYRVTGKSHQNTGVKPDVALPFLGSWVPYGEAMERNSLPNLSVTKTTYYKALPQPKLEEIILKSKSRLAINSGFKQLLAIDSSIMNFITVYNYVPLSLNDYSEFLRHKNDIRAKIDALNSGTTSTFIVNTDYRSSALNAIYDPMNLIDTQMKQSLQGDIHLEETYLILCDYINLINK